MMNRGRLTVAALAIVAGLAATGVLHKASSAAGRVAPTESMVVASAALGERHVLTAKDLKLVKVRERPAGAFERLEDLEGRLPMVPVPAGQPVLSSHLAPVGADASLSSRVPTGHRAITVAINEVVGVGGFLGPGLHVDLIGVSQDGDSWTTTLVAQDVPVLAVAQEDRPAKRAAAPPKVATSATLLVTPAQAKAISLATEKGRIRLVLRAPNDHAKVPDQDPVTRPAIKQAQAAAPAPTRAAASKPASKPASQPATQKKSTNPPDVKPAAPSPIGGIEVISGDEMEVVYP